MTATVTLTLPEPHDAQRQVMDEAQRFNVLRCGRRWGKTALGIILVVIAAIEGKPCAWFAPTYRMQTDVWREVLEVLSPFGRMLKVDKRDRRITLPGGGYIDFWSLDRDSTVRGKKYALALVDEAAYVRELERVWNAVIRPTLTDYRGDAWFMSTPLEAHDYFNGTLYARGMQGTVGWASWCMPTVSNPYIDAEEVALAKTEMPEAAWRNEYLGEPAEHTSSPFGWEFIEAACCLKKPVPGPVDVWGVDLAKSIDYTVALGLNRDRECSAFQRWQSDWRNTTARLDRMLRDGHKALVDSSGVGDPIVERLAAKNPRVEGYKFTSTSRQALMEGLAQALQRGEVRVPGGVIRDELRAFRYEFKGGRVRYAAPDGIHDDTVMALALAVRASNVRPAPVELDIGPDIDFDDEDDW